MEPRRAPAPRLSFGRVGNDPDQRPGLPPCFFCIEPNPERTHASAVYPDCRGHILLDQVSSMSGLEVEERQVKATLKKTVRGAKERKLEGTSWVPYLLGFCYGICDYLCHKVPIKTAEYVLFRAFPCISLHIGTSARRAFIHQDFRTFQRVGWEGLEPSTNALKGRCSTVELPTRTVFVAQSSSLRAGVLSGPGDLCHRVANFGMSGRNKSQFAAWRKNCSRDTRARARLRLLPGLGAAFRPLKRLVLRPGGP